MKAITVHRSDGNETPFSFMPSQFLGATSEIWGTRVFVTIAPGGILDVTESYEDMMRIIEETKCQSSE
jgi:hypothetical protein